MIGASTRKKPNHPAWRVAGSTSARQARLRDNGTMAGWSIAALCRRRVARKLISSVIYGESELNTYNLLKVKAGKLAKLLPNSTR
jgi:hypothetical protein